MLFLAAVFLVNKIYTERERERERQREREREREGGRGERERERERESSCGPATRQLFLPMVLVI